MELSDPILQVRKQRPKDAKYLAQGHTAGKRQNMNRGHLPLNLMFQSVSWTASH